MGLWHCLALAALHHPRPPHLVLSSRRRRKRDTSSAKPFKENELVVVVGACLRRMLGPFNYLMDQLLAEDSPVRRFLLPAGVKRVPCPMPRARRTHGPQRQVRLRPAAPPVPQLGQGHGRGPWETCSTTGCRAEPMANYIMMSRPEKLLVVLLHDTPTGAADRRDQGLPGGGEKGARQAFAPPGWTSTPPTKVEVEAQLDQLMGS